ncbi:hypothetical protein RB195_009559 [Necator americanus]|uniref:Uncharacterized protein n=1 Tax=Necator americanus TaxID=51031 RepID=A0ABR1CTV2_NECAM
MSSAYLQCLPQTDSRGSGKAVCVQEDIDSTTVRVSKDKLLAERLDTHTEDAPLTIEDLVAEYEDFTALKMDKKDMEGSHDVHVVEEKINARTYLTSISEDVLYALSSTQAQVSRLVHVERGKARISSLGTLYYAGQGGRRITDEDR